MSPHIHRLCGLMRLLGVKRRRYDAATVNVRMSRATLDIVREALRQRYAVPEGQPLPRGLLRAEFERAVLTHVSTVTHSAQLGPKVKCPTCAYEWHRRLSSKGNYAVCPKCHRTFNVKPRPEAGAS